MGWIRWPLGHLASAASEWGWSGVGNGSLYSGRGIVTDPCPALVSQLGKAPYYPFSFWFIFFFCLILSFSFPASPLCLRPLPPPPRRISEPAAPATARLATVSWGPPSCLAPHQPAPPGAPFCGKPPDQSCVVAFVPFTGLSELQPRVQSSAQRVRSWGVLREEMQAGPPGASRCREDVRLPLEGMSEVAGQ